jgi:2-methylisocitrate lyase-like PEP mutase family enzyme
VLPNAWDAASAALVAEAGATAVATSSAAVAWSLGAPDGERLSREHALDLVARVVGVVGVPVTADLESGFAADPDGVAETIRGVLAAGAVGVNLEDSWHGGPTTLRPTPEQAARIAAARRAADEAGVPLYINARVDTFLRGTGDVAETLDRAKAYVSAGASGVFVPGVVDAATISVLVAGVGVPLNILAGPGAPPVPELGRLGVARVSVGAAIARSAYAVALGAARELLATGTYDALVGGLPSGELNSLLSRD